MQWLSFVNILHCCRSYAIGHTCMNTNQHIMMTSSNGNIFRVTGPLCGEFTGSGEFPTQRPVTRSFDVFFDLRLNKRLSKQPWGWWFETPSRSLLRQCNISDSHWRTLCRFCHAPINVTHNLHSHTVLSIRCGGTRMVPWVSAVLGFLWNSWTYIECIT